ncbi:uncharacterized protein LOC143723729 [Siphateles boraxobius]|uniref:uncharacterized protein LOC143723729 n=1 Tax=Siphateles boraxobius TaxID=180520 RepID=UPI004063C1B3
MKMFRTVFFYLCFWRLDGVFGDEDELKIMMKGKSVTLNSDLTEIKDDDVIQWRFEYYEETLIAEINKRADRIAVYDDVLDGRFRDRLKLNNQTGSLTITNITTEHAGDYKLRINSVRKRKIYIDSSGSVRSVLVTEGESLTLNSGFTEIKDDDEIQWMFGNENILIAEINVKADRIAVYDDYLGRFRDRLKLNNQTGSLTITNITTEHAGDYKLERRGYRRLLQGWISFVFLAVFVEISVKEGESLTVNSDLTEIQDGDWIQWRFENTLIAEINKRDDRIAVYDYVLDGRFRDRLKLNNQTGSLTITNIRPEHAGDYKLQMSQYGFSLKAFRVSVFARLPVPVINRDCSSSSSPSGFHPNPISNQTQHLNITQLCHTCSDSVHCCGPTEAVIRLVLSALVGVATVILLVYDIRSRRAE